MYISHEELKRLLHYDPETGAWTRLTSHPGNYKAGDRAEHWRKNEQYFFVKVQCKAYLAHRLAVFYMTGEWPTAVTDHKNTLKSDNRWVNIRPATWSQNRANTRKYHKSKSGYRGVYWEPRWKTWYAKIVWEGKQHHLGCRKSAHDAHLLYVEAAKKYFGEFFYAE